MSIKVIRGRVDTGEKVYLSGELIFGLKANEEQELVSLGVCEYVSDAPVQAEKPASEELPEGLTKLKGGYYSLPDGSKVQGKDKALEALDALQSAASQSIKEDDDDDGDGDNDDSDNDGDAPDTTIPGLDAE